MLGPLFMGAFASDRIWHSEKIRCGCKFSLRSAREGFAGFGALCLPTLLLAHSCAPALLSTQILLKVVLWLSSPTPIQGLGSKGCPCRSPIAPQGMPSPRSSPSPAISVLGKKRLLLLQKQRQHLPPARLN